MVEPQWSSYKGLSSAEKKRARQVVQGTAIPETDELASAALAWGRRQIVIGCVTAAALFLVGFIAQYLVPHASILTFLPAVGVVINTFKSGRQLRELSTLLQSREGTQPGR